ncbi:hypothetical protein MKX03_010161 [Papaver bracteatum]|nr:hypothetical protein MKX03_010161 [Papaver bracteatum]
MSETKNDRSKTFREKEPVECPAGDRVKVALLLIVHVFLFGRQLKDQVDKEHWPLVENLKHFNTFPWGAKSYALLFEKTQTAFVRQVEKKKPQKLCSLKPGGIPQALVVWMLKLFPHLFGKYGKELDCKRPRLLLLTVVLCEKINTYKNFCDDMKGIIFSEDILKKIRAVGEEFHEAAWEEGVSENHDLEDASADGPHDDKYQATDSSDDNTHVIPVVPEQKGVEVTVGDAGRGSNLGVVQSADFFNNLMANVRKEFFNSVQLMIDGVSEKMTQSFNSLEQRIESVDSMVHQLLKTIGAPPDIHMVGGSENVGPSKNGRRVLEEILTEKVEGALDGKQDMLTDKVLSEKEDADAETAQNHEDYNVEEDGDRVVEM